MKKTLLSGGLLALAIPALSVAHPANLVEVFQQALTSDPVWLQAVSQNLSDKEGVPISLAGLLPALTLTTTGPSVSRTISSGSAALLGNGSSRGYDIQLNLTQTVFDFGKIADLASVHALAKGADATLNAATQDLIIRVARAYFQILSDQDYLAYLGATRKAYEKQLEQANQQYHVGLKTITDVYTARASYESAVADYIGAEATLATDRENLRAITGRLYPSLARLRDHFPLVKPQPASIDQWVTKAGEQNWSIKSAQYTAISKKNLIKKQFAGHLPVFTAEAGWQNQYSWTSSSYIFDGANGSNRTETSSISLNMNLPLVEGGLVMAETRQAQYDYQVALQQLEHVLRSTLTQTRQSYLNVVAGISKIKADHQAIRSNISSLKGMEAGYQVGTEILVNVLNQQENVFQAETQYTNDRFAWLNNLLALKQAAGTLSIEDLKIINRWLGNRHDT